MLKLDAESSYLMTFNTFDGRFRYIRLKFGLSYAQDNGAIPCIKYSFNVQDIVVGVNEKKQNKRFNALLQHTEQLNMKFNAGKLRNEK